MRVSVGATSEFKWFRSVPDPSENPPRKMHSWVFVGPCTHNALHDFKLLMDTPDGQP